MDYDGHHSQSFTKDGLTRYDETTGRWRISGDQYCSQWPPSQTWVCYEMAIETSLGRVRFTGPAGEVAEAGISARPD